MFKNINFGMSMLCFWVSYAIVTCIGVFHTIFNIYVLKMKPMDEKMLYQLANRPIVTMEEHVLTGGFGSVVCAFLSGEGLPAPMLSFGIPDTFVQHGRRDQLLKYLGLTPELMTQRIVIALKNGEKHQ